MSMKSMTSFESYLVFNVDISSSMQNHYEKFEIKIFIKEEEKVKRIIVMIVSLTIQDIYRDQTVITITRLEI